MLSRWTRRVVAGGDAGGAGVGGDDFQGAHAGECGGVAGGGGAGEVVGAVAGGGAGGPERLAAVEVEAVERPGSGEILQLGLGE